MTKIGIPASSVLILSSHSNPRLSAPINHQSYAIRHGYRYLFDSTPYISISKYDQKYHSILSSLGSCEWLFWIDNDVYFMNHSVRLEDFIPNDDNVDFVFCDSPVNEGKRTVLNSGAFFVRNRDSARQFLRTAMATRLAEVRDWWNPEIHGLFTKGDQDQIVYVAMKQSLIGNSIQVVDHTCFNARYFQYVDTHDQYFAVHLCGEPSKKKQIDILRKRFDLDPYLMPHLAPEHEDSFKRSAYYVDVRSIVTRFTEWSTQSINLLFRKLKRTLIGNKRF